jgi:NADPH:quinone reductase-like Zn-dependent oxidoreductase
MKAVLLTAYGGVDKLVLKNVPEPELGPHDVKVRVRSAGINPVDYKIRRGEMRGRWPIELPTILGRDAAGVVMEVGREVSELAVGDRVMGLVEHAYAEIVVAPADAFAKLPEGLDIGLAAALPLAGLTGTQLMDEVVAPERGDLVLVTGAVGSVGRVAVFAAKQRGAIVVAGVRGEQKALAETLDPDDVVAIDDDAEIDDLPPLDAIADTVDGEVVDRLLGKLKDGGMLGTVLGVPPRAKAFNVTVHTMLAHPDPSRLARIGESVAHGELVVPIEKQFPLSEVQAAQEMAEQHGVGKVLLVP